MTNTQRLEEIQQRLEILALLDIKLDKIIELLENKNKSCEPMTTFVKANNVENTFIEDRQKELFNSLDCKE